MLALLPSAPIGAAKGPIRLARAGHAMARRLARRLALRVATSRQVDFWMREVDPTWSPTATRARVVDVVLETHDVATFVLAPNRRWPGHRAGQFVPVDVEIDGVRTTRCYSIASAPGEALLRITVKRVPGGRVSSWMHAHLRRGAVLGLGAPGGELHALPDAPGRLLLLSGGSGVTPMMSILRDRARRDAVGDVVFVHAARSRRDVLFERELGVLAARHPGLRIVFVRDDDVAGGGRLDGARLQALVPDLAARDTKLCGPPGMMEALLPLWAGPTMSKRVQVERFTAPARPRPEAPGAGPGEVTLTLARSGRTVTSTPTGTLLEQLEAGGERPASGCRMGICNTCLCRKRSGVTEDITTGVVSDEPDQDIRLCVSRARTDVELAL